MTVKMLLLSEAGFTDNTVHDKGTLIPDNVVMKIFVHRRKTERMVQKWNVQRCTCKWYIYVNNKERVRC